MAVNADTRYTNDPTRNVSSGNKDTRTTHDPTIAQGAPPPETPSITSWRMMRGIGQACFLLFLTIVDRFLKDRV